MSSLESDILARCSRINSSLSRSVEKPLNLNEVLSKVNTEFGSERSFILSRHGVSPATVVGSAGFSVSDFRRFEGRVLASISPKILDIREGVGYFRSIEEVDVQAPAPTSRLVIVELPVDSHRSGVLGLEFAAPGSRFMLPEVTGLLASMIVQAMRVERVAAGERERLREENLHLKYELKEKYDFSHLIGTSGAIRQVYEQVAQVAKSHATVLLRGESGTGKELIASAIHYNSLRAKRPFIKVNCAALPDTLIESELFGYERGAFTGADRSKRGRFEMAEGGTLFLDEIGDLPLQTQIKLLRVLQEREFERLGGTETLRTNIRLITATNKNLEAAMEKGDFREDLYYRLNVFTIFLPPLRERKSDILLLAEHFLEKYEKEHGKHIRRISTPAIDMLMAYHFPGNVRELENAIERAVLVCDGSVIHGHHLPPTLQTAEVSGTETTLTLSSAVAGFERDLIADTLKSTGGNIAKAARQLESTERILGYKIKKYGIDPQRFRR